LSDESRVEPENEGGADHHHPIQVVWQNRGSPAASRWAVSPGGEAPWLQPKVCCQRRFLAPVGEGLGGHCAPCQLNTVCRFRGTSFPWGKAVTDLGRGAHRLSQRFY